VSRTKNVVVTRRVTGANRRHLVGFSSPPPCTDSSLGMIVTNVYASVQHSFRHRRTQPRRYQVRLLRREDARSFEVRRRSDGSGRAAEPRPTRSRHLVDWARGSAVQGCAAPPPCVRSPSVLVPLNAIVVLTDDSGAFVLEGRPDGRHLGLMLPGHALLDVWGRPTYGDQRP